MRKDLPDGDSCEDSGRYSPPQHHRLCNLGVSINFHSTFAQTHFKSPTSRWKHTVLLAHQHETRKPGYNVRQQEGGSMEEISEDGPYGIDNFSAGYASSTLFSCQIHGRGGGTTVVVIPNKTWGMGDNSVIFQQHDRKAYIHQLFPINTGSQVYVLSIIAFGLVMIRSRTTAGSRECVTGSMPCDCYCVRKAKHPYFVLKCHGAPRRQEFV